MKPADAYAPLRVWDALEVGPVRLEPERAGYRIACRLRVLCTGPDFTATVIVDLRGRCRRLHRPRSY